MIRGPLANNSTRSPLERNEPPQRSRAELKGRKPAIKSHDSRLQHFHEIMVWLSGEFLVTQVSTPRQDSLVNLFHG